MSTEEQCAANRSYKYNRTVGQKSKGCCKRTCPNLPKSGSGSKNYDKILVASPEEKLFPVKSGEDIQPATPSLRTIDVRRVHENRHLLGQQIIIDDEDSRASSFFGRASGALVPAAEYYNQKRVSGERGVKMQDMSTGHQMKMSASGIVYTLQSIREPIVEYQESRGVPRNEEITFITLITSLCTQAYTAAITILVMLWNLVPLLDGFVYFARFTLDKLIDIIQTEDTKDKAIKAALFVGELIVILFIIFLIMGLIFMPVYVLTARLVGKVWSMIAW